MADFSAKQPSEAYAISFDFSVKLGAETIASATITAIDQNTLADVSLAVLDVAKQALTDSVVYGWVMGGVSGHNYLITCLVLGSEGSIYELEGVLPVLETPVVGSGSGGTGPVVGPPVEPVSLQEMKEHLRLDSGFFNDNLEPIQSIVPGSHATTTLYSLVGASADVLGLSATVILDAGTNGATGTVDVKIQESDDRIAWTDWTGGAFAQVTTANDNAIQQKAYTGSKQYIRVVAKVLLAACEFGVSIAKYAGDSTEDVIISTLITAARQQAEAITWRAFISQTWDMHLDAFPVKNFIALPYGQLQSVASVTYTDSDGVSRSMVPTTDYLVDTSSEPGRVVLASGASWPSFTPSPVNPITVRFTCGYGSTAASVPAGIKVAIKMMAEDLYNNRSAQHVMGAGSVTENKVVMAMLWPFRLWGF